MTHQHGRRRARVTFSDAAAKQLEDLTSEADLHALDRALGVVSVDPDIGEPLPANATSPQLRQYTDEIERVRLLYWVTALRTGVVVT
jgi:Mn-dependent DtxR family transcriptional regulator